MLFPLSQRCHFDNAQLQTPKRAGLRERRSQESVCRTDAAKEIRTMLKAIVTTCAMTALATAAIAQQPTPAPPIGPTALECQNGYKPGMQWTHDEFVSACAKLREGKQN
jgi:hypothetical protein